MSEAQWDAVREALLKNLAKKAGRVVAQHVAAEAATGGAATPFLIASDILTVGNAILQFTHGVSVGPEAGPDPQGYFGAAGPGYHFEWRPCSGGGGSYRANAPISGASPACGNYVAGTVYPDPQAALDAISVGHLENVALFGNAVLGIRPLAGVWFFIPSSAGYPDMPWQKIAPVPNSPLYVQTPHMLADSPDILPIFRPVGVPTPKKWEDAKADPETQPKQEPIRAPVPVLPVLPFPVVVEAPPGVDVHVPDQVIEVGPGAGSNPSQGPVVRTEPPPKGPPGPPPAHVKERKAKWSKGARVVWGIGNSATELFEFIDDLFRALPKECKPPLKTASGKRRPYTPFEKAKAIYACADHMDISQAITNVVNDQLHDMFYGAIGQQMGKASKNLGILTGLQHLLRQSTGLFGLDGVDTHVPLPTLVLTKDKKAWELVIK